MRAWPSGLAQWLEKRQRGSSSLEVRERALRANPQAAAGPELTASALRRARACMSSPARADAACFHGMFFTEDPENVGK